MVPDHPLHHVPSYMQIDYFQPVCIKKYVASSLQVALAQQPLKVEPLRATPVAFWLEHSMPLVKRGQPMLPTYCFPTESKFMQNARPNPSLFFVCNLFVWGWNLATTILFDLLTDLSGWLLQCMSGNVVAWSIFGHWNLGPDVVFEILEL